MIMSNFLMSKRDIAWIWEISLKFMYAVKYVKSLDGFLKENNVRRLLDCSCGVGFPAIGLKKLGYDIVCSDADEKMLRRFRHNCVMEGVRIEAKRLRWQQLSNAFGQEFDCVLCRGNSLPYVVSWVGENVDVRNALPEIEKSIQGMFRVLKPGGLLYVDASPREAFTPKQTVIEENFGCRKDNSKTIEMVWRIRHDLVNHTREWSPEIIIKSKGSNLVEKARADFKGYHLTHSELLQAMEKAGFRGIEKYREIEGEKNYDVFIGHKWSSWI